MENETAGFWAAFFASDAWLLVGVGLVMGAFDKLFELLIEIRDWFNPIFVVDEFEEGLVLRFGVFNRSVKPGLHWRWPCSIEREIVTTVKRRTSYLQIQSVTSRDGKSINISPIVIYQISNLKRWELEVDDAEDAINDITYGLNEQLAMQTDADEIFTPEYRKRLTTMVYQEGLAWGAKVVEVKFSDKVTSKSLRLWTDSYSPSDLAP